MSGPKRGRSAKRGRHGTGKSGKPTRHEAPHPRRSVEHEQSRQAEFFGAHSRRDHEDERAQRRRRDARIGLWWMIGAAIGVSVSTLIAWYPPESSMLVRLAVMVVASMVFVVLLRAFGGPDRARAVTPSTGMTFAGLSLVMVALVLNSRWNHPLTILPTLAGLALLLLSTLRRRREREDEA